MENKPEEIYLSDSDVKSCFNAKDAINVVKEGNKGLRSREVIQPEKLS